MLMLSLAQHKVLVQLPACFCQASRLPALIERAVARFSNCLLNIK
jgi:hypothetical protein